MNGCQFGGEEHDEDHEHLATHQELLNVVRLVGLLAQLVGTRVGVPVGLRVLSLELHQGDLLMVLTRTLTETSTDLEPLHEGQPEEEDEEEDEGGPARDGVPEVGLLLDDGVEGDDQREYEEESAADKPGVVPALGLGYRHHDWTECRAA